MAVARRPNAPPALGLLLQVGVEENGTPRHHLQHAPKSAPPYVGSYSFRTRSLTEPDDGSINVAHLIAAELAGERAHDGGFVARDREALRLQRFVGGTDLLTKLLLDVDLADGVINVRAESFDVVRLVFLEQQREQRIVTQDIRGLERIPAGGDDRRFVNAGGPVDGFHALRFALPHRDAAGRLGYVPNRAFGARELFVGHGAVALFHLRPHRLVAGNGIVARAQLAQ